MPKVSKAGKFRKAAAKQAEHQQTDNATKTIAGAPTLSRGQRRRQAKREQYLKREKMILSSLQLKREEEQKKRIDGLDALKQALSTVDTTTTTTSEQEDTQAVSTTTLKAKKNLATREMQHMNLVLQHPEFQSNPFEAIQLHLKNTLASQAREQDKRSKERTRLDMQKQEERKKLKKERIQAAGGKHRKKFHAARKTR